MCYAYAMVISIGNFSSINCDYEGKERRPVSAIAPAWKAHAYGVVSVYIQIPCPDGIYNCNYDEFRMMSRSVQHLINVIVIFLFSCMAPKSDIFGERS